MESEGAGHGEADRRADRARHTLSGERTKSPLVELEITHFERPSGWAYRNDGPLAVDLTTTLEPVDDGRATILRSRFDATAYGVVRLILPLLIASLRREEARNMQLI